MKDRRVPLTEARRHGDTETRGDEVGIEGEELRGLFTVIELESVFWIFV